MTNYQKYAIMWHAWKTGVITQKEWTDYCYDVFMNDILTNPEIVAIMKRLKDR